MIKLLVNSLDIRQWILLTVRNHLLRKQKSSFKEQNLTERKKAEVVGKGTQVAVHGALTA
jgi:DNA-directed RNA polymerase specialized sigma54-like protein